MDFTLSVASVRCDAKNCSYPVMVRVSDADGLADAAKFDHVCGEFRKDYRSTANFIRADVIVMDCDNDHSDDPAEWLTEDKLDGMMACICYALVPSRNHMLVKNGKSARPRFHVYFPVGEVTDAWEYAELKRAVQAEFPFFDGNALDAARFIFGADSGDVVWHDGFINIDEEVGQPDFDEGLGNGSGPIVAGTRNSTLSRFAGRALKRYGECGKAHQLFMEEADKCDPPLDGAELRAIWFSALKFYRSKVRGQPGYVPPDAFNGGAGKRPLKPEDYSDIGQAKVLVQEYGDELRYSDATDYLRYDGDRWVEDRQMAVGAVEEFLDLQLADAQDAVEAAKKLLVEHGVPEDAANSGKKIEKGLTAGQLPFYFMLLAAQQYLAFVMKRRDYKYITATLNAAKPMLAVSVNDLDRDGNLLNTPYATFDLSKGMVGERPHAPEDLITKMTECSPGDEGAQVWQESLELFFCGDRELIEYVQQVVGMAAVGKVYQEHLIIAYGGGANGKSTFWNTVSRVLGTYSGKLSAETLTVGCRRNVKPEMAELKGRRLIIASEMEEGVRLNTAVVKQLCSTDEVFAEKKYKAPFSFVPSHTLVLYTNHLPKVGANDDGIWRRLIVIPFNARIMGASDIKNYADYLFEHAGGAVMKWIIEGAEKAIAAGFRTPLPGCVEDAINAYREENDWLGHFIAECCEVDASYTEKSGELYQQYRAYCIQNGEYVRSTTDFYNAVEKAGYPKRRQNTGMFVIGLRLKAGRIFWISEGRAGWG